MQSEGTFCDDTCHICSVVSRYFSDFSVPKQPSGWELLLVLLELNSYICRSGERVSCCKCDIIICGCTKFSILNTDDSTESNGLCRDSYGEVK
jgi:hypothetical protein